MSGESSGVTADTSSVPEQKRRRRARRARNGHRFIEQCTARPISARRRFCCGFELANWGPASAIGSMEFSMKWYKIAIAGVLVAAALLIVLGTPANFLTGELQ